MSELIELNKPFVKKSTELHRSFGNTRAEVEKTLKRMMEYSDQQLLEAKTQRRREIADHEFWLRDQAKEKLQNVVKLITKGTNQNIEEMDRNYANYRLHLEEEAERRRLAIKQQSRKREIDLQQAQFEIDRKLENLEMLEKQTKRRNGAFLQT